MSKVFIVNNYGGEYTDLFIRRGWEIVSTISEADLVQFTGGSDVDPAFYGHRKHPLTHSNKQRDRAEKLIYKICLKNNKPMAGICRGGQFLNVMNGGKMWQHVTGHCCQHPATCFDIDPGVSLLVTSTHHQMIIPVNDVSRYRLLLTANLRERRTKCSPLNSRESIMNMVGLKRDIEALIYTNTRCLCFQPHPEFKKQDTLANLYFKYVKEIMKCAD